MADDASRLANIELTDRQQEQYRDIVATLNLESIDIRSCRYHREPGEQSFEGVLGINISRGSAEPYNVGDAITIYPAYRIRMLEEERLLALFEITYEVRFKLQDRPLLDKLLGDEALRDFFMFYQMDKFVWPYLRRDFHDACGRLGIRPPTLPMIL